MHQSKLKRRSSGQRIVYALAFLIPFLGYIGVMIFSGHKPFGSSSILYSDMYHQYYPFFVEFRRTLRSGGSLLYNWNMGMGVDYLSLIAYYLASPLNLLSVLVPEAWLLSFFSLLVPIKLGLAGLFFTIFLTKTCASRPDPAAALFGAAYGLCAWALGYQWNIMWLDTFALLPLVILGMVSLLKKRHFVLYTFTLFLSIASNYYIGLFTCIFVALCFFVYEICEVDRVKRLFTDLFLLATFSILAIGLTAILELPAFIGLGRTNSSINEFPTGFVLNIAHENTIKGLFDAMRQVAGNSAAGITPTYKEGLPNLYCGILPILLTGQFFLDRRFKLREKICNLLMLLFFMLSFILRQLDYIWHGFHFTNMIPYRFSFLCSFVVLCMAYRAYRVADHCPRWRIIVSAVVFLGIAACSDQRFQPLFLVYNLVFMVIYLALLLLKRHPRVRVTEAEDGPVASLVPLTKEDKHWNRRLSVLVLGAMLLEMVCALVPFSIGFGGTNITNYPRGTADAADVIRFMHTVEKDQPFYRAEVTHTQSLNDDALNNYSGITMFSSAVDVRVTKIMHALGFGAKPSYNRYAFEEASPVANLYLNLKYLICRDGKRLPSELYHSVYNMGNVYLLKNEAYLPLGFAVEDDILNLSFDESSAGSFIFQNQLFSCTTGLEGSVYRQIYKYESHADSSSTSVNTKKNSGNIGYTTGDDSDHITISFEVPSDGFVCFDVYATKRNDLTVYRNEEILYTENLSLEQMLAVGDCLKGDLIEVNFACKANETGRIDFTAAVLDDALFLQGAELLSQHPLQITSMSDTELTGEIQADSSCILYTSIPYNENWSAEVDGNSVEPIPLLGAMLGVPLTAGTHTVTFVYRNQAFQTGAVISLISLAAFSVLVFLAYRPRKKGKFSA